jgi:beta-glucanase (GH16 family)
MRIFPYLFKCFLVTFSLFTFLILISCRKNLRDENKSRPVSSSNALAEGTSAVNYQLIWSDEFDGNKVNTSNWNFETGGGGWGNHEQEYYQAANATVSNGNLLITAKKQRVKSNAYTSARMTTKGKHEFTYGKVEARIKIPLGQGLWPAFWMLGANIDATGWPKCGETDIMEHINADSLVYGTIHWDNNGHVQYGGKTITSLSDYHIYSVEWDSAAIRWYVDGNKYQEANILNNINSTEEFHKPSFIILNLAVGGDWPGQTIDVSKFPATMYVDYVRVYKGA